MFRRARRALVVRVAAPPAQGAANDALIVSGDRARQKRVAIAGVTPDQIRALW